MRRLVPTVLILSVAMLFMSCDSSVTDGGDGGDDGSTGEIEFTVSPSSGLLQMINDTPGDFTWDYYRSNLNVSMPKGEGWSGEVVIKSAGIYADSVQPENFTSSSVETSYDELSDEMSADDLFPGSEWVPGMMWLPTEDWQPTSAWVPGSMWAPSEVVSEARAQADLSSNQAMMVAYVKVADTTERDQVVVPFGIIFNNTANDTTEEISSDITSDRTLAADTYYIVTDDISIENSAELTIEPGTHLVFESGASFSVSSGSALIADGTAQDSIRMTATPGNEQRGWWQGIAFYSNNQNSVLDHVSIKHAGQTDFGGISRPANVSISDDSYAELTNSNLTMSAGYGLYVDGPGSEMDFMSNRFADNASGTMWIPSTLMGTIDSGTEYADADDFVRVWGANITSGSMTVNSLSADTPYRFSSDFDISNNAAVTIESGVEMEFESGVGISVYSQLSAMGSSDDMITMTATPGNEQQAWWQGVVFYSNSQNNVLKNVVIRHAGQTDFGGISRAANVAVSSGSYVELTNVTLEQSGGFGLYVDGTDSDMSFANNTFNGNADSPMWIPATLIGEIDANSTFPSQSYVRVWGANINSGDITVNALQNDVPYRISSSFSVEGDASMSIEPGVEMEFESNVGISVHTHLVASGTSGEEILMTALPDNQSAGSWKGIAFYSDNPNNELNWIEINYGGSEDFGGISQPANISLSDGSSLTLTNSTISNSAGAGVYCDNSTAEFNGSSNVYQNNAEGGIINCSQ